MKKCMYIGCLSEDISSNDNYVEVKTVLPNAAGLKKLKSKLQIKWKRNGEAVFHRTCWNDLSKSSRARKKYPNLPVLSAEEKCLVKEASKTAEFFDSEQSLNEKAAKCAQLIKSSEHCTAFTGAGISTSAGIGDYRGKSGKWTQQDQDAVDMDAVLGTSAEPLDEEEDEVVAKKLKKSDSHDNDVKEEVEEEEPGGVSYESLRPTYTHEAMQKLVEKGYLKYIISQNGDGLHGLSGVPADNMSELHGNVFIEICNKCNTRYSRPYYTMDDTGSQYYEEVEDYGKSTVSKPPHARKCDRCGLSHRTGRRCEKKGCKGHLKDSIINFGDLLEEDILDRAKHHAECSDLMLCLGSTLMVTPANSLVEMTKEPHRLAICNRQKTHMDRKLGGGVRVFGDCDVFMKEVMRGVLEVEELTTWEEARQKRMKHYDSQRTPV
ncbi:NAD-dependent protein deacetylase Sirt6-like [Haliotis rufescens]|uniref:NAD-dependent protein deacetylase Sirt6-like n=1 Tax=Haliotis rufescens TaxID=6454 RepID=UPI00201FACDB|nr:NAD-dependent protein deacetylase Sirt6-like [Haliotis rufescens]